MYKYIFWLTIKNSDCRFSLIVLEKKSPTVSLSNYAFPRKQINFSATYFRKIHLWFYSTSNEYYYSIQNKTKKRKANSIFIPEMATGKRFVQATSIKAMPA